MIKLKPYFQLVRLPNLFTAAADSLAGYLIVGGPLDRPPDWLPLVVVSVCLYAFGIVLNDLNDHQVDLVERPSRPLPSGRVSVRAASRIIYGTLIVMICSTVLMRPEAGAGRSRVVIPILTLCISAYNTRLKRTQLAPIVMGSCRGLNLLLGLSYAPGLGGPDCWLVAGSLAVFVAGVTWISRSEVETGRRNGIALGISVQVLGLLGLVLGAIRLAGSGEDRSSFAPHLGSGLLVLTAVGLLVGRADARAFLRPEPRATQLAVKTGVLSLVWLDVALVASAQGPAPALAVAALWLPAFLLGRWLYST